MTSDALRSGASSIDSYIGSLISLTSKYEIRYEGVLYNINTEESGVGLPSEGRKNLLKLYNRTVIRVCGGVEESTTHRWSNISEAGNQDVKVIMRKFIDDPESDLPVKSRQHESVKSFGTEGRKKDGQQIPPSDKIYEYILFRGSDIKDLQVKASPPVQASPIHNDPAIIQSHYARPTSTPPNMPTAGTGTAVELSLRTAQVGPQRPTFQGDLSLHQPGGNLGSWGSLPLPPAQNGSGLAVPFYWQGYYTPPGGLPHLQQPSLFRPPPGVPIPHAMQQPLQYPGTSASLPSGTPKIPEIPALLSQPGGSTLNLTSTTLPSTLRSSQISSSFPDTTSVLSYKPPISSFPAPVLSANISPVPPLDSSLKAGATVSSNLPSFGSSKPSTVPLAAKVYQTMPQSMPMAPIVGSNIPSQLETLLPLVTPGQLLQPDLPTISTSQPPQASVKSIEVKPADAKIKWPLPESSIPAASGTKGPILPLPTVIDQKPNATILQTHLSSRGSARGRGNAYPRPVNKFTEDFDFMAMNEKFKKDEVWGDLGKPKGHLKDMEGEENGAGYIIKNEESDSSNIEPIYVKEDFFDSLSSNAIARGGRNGRTRFSEQLKLDAETFGEFQRHRQGRGGGRGFRGGRTRGSYNGRGYGYIGRGRGHNTGSPAN